MGAPCAFLFRPSAYSWKDFGKALVEKIEKTSSRPRQSEGWNDLPGDPGTTLESARHGHIAAGCPDLNSGDVSHIFGNGRVQGRRGQRPAIGNEEHQQGQQREREYEAAIIAAPPPGEPS